MNYWAGFIVFVLFGAHVGILVGQIVAQLIINRMMKS